MAKKQKTITEQFDEIKSEVCKIKSDVCDNLCKWQARAQIELREDDSDKVFARLAEHCDRCPLNRL